MKHTPLPWTTLFAYWFFSFCWLVQWCFLLRGRSLCLFLTISYEYYSAQSKCKLICFSLLVVGIAVVSLPMSVGFLTLASLSLWNSLLFHFTHPPSILIPHQFTKISFFSGSIFINLFKFVQIVLHIKGEVPILGWDKISFFPKWAALPLQ